MIHKHLNDAEIQQYILQNVYSEVDIINHIHYCPACKLKVEQYKFLFEGIKQQEKPVFDFNLADLVIEQLPKPIPTPSNDNSFFYIVIFIAILCVGIGSYFLQLYFLNMFFEMKPIFFGVIITTCMSLFVFQCLDLYRKYKLQIKDLNFY